MLREQRCEEITACDMCQRLSEQKLRKASLWLMRGCFRGAQATPGHKAQLSGSCGCHGAQVAE